ncbi:GerAB/ArcD/ProY family transporter [Bacillus sp. ISL-47]|uniref:GerAB/ArcD/ProY family transporter n=1 Tax=Bacillus sp. ISL-47 TaxID=2819130 RepID=UPI001BE6487A|nr:GerAB/ArcD/ProY family transporter [Bacillus sp. ISL-47]MBT2688215.1 GerAB/ArcD/ProY family transporter [Bacillus sp. ISL-47]MBT2710009.1 GerAB/ArcD/ProY family transporter [Pseudomonas sp. ISL-84]
MKNRYLYYLIILNMLANLIVFVPRILIDERRDGAVMALILALPLGIAVIFLFIGALSKFPGKGLPEILMVSFLPVWMGKVMLVCFSMIWITSGIISLIAFTHITERFINPDMQGWQIGLLFIVFVSLAVLLKTKKVLFLLEIVLILNGPLAIFLVLKIFLSGSIDWQEVREGTTYIFEMANWKSLSASTYLFSGYANMVIFNRMFKKKIGRRHLWLFIPAGAGMLITTYFVPIGIYGFDAVGEIEYPWLTSADAIRMEFGFVERVFFIFLLMYIGISLINVIVHWHVGQQLIIGAFPGKKRKNKRITLEHLLLGLFSGMYFFLLFYLNETESFKLAEWWMKIRMPGEYFMVILLIIVAWRKK